MSVIVLDGPEKAGKTTLARQVMALDPSVRYRHWGPVASITEYDRPLVDDVPPDHLVIWDRSWASEHVYDRLLRRGAVLGADPWYGEWKYGTSARSNGLLVMMLGEDPSVLESRRTPDDHTVIPAEVERAQFKWYAHEYGWQVYEGNPPDLAADLLTMVYAERARAGGRHVPVWAGPWDARVVFVGDRRNESSGFGWRPFDSRYTREYGLALGRDAVRCAWTNTDCDPGWLRGRAVVACGQVAAGWCYQQCVNVRTMVPHPSYLFRWGKMAGMRTGVVEEIRYIVSKEMQNG